MGMSTIIFTVHIDEQGRVIGDDLKHAQFGFRF